MVPTSPLARRWHPRGNPQHPRRLTPAGHRQPCIAPSRSALTSSTPSGRHHHLGHLPLLACFTDNGAIFTADNAATAAPPGNRPRRTRHPIRPLPPLSPPNLRQSRTLPTKPRRNTCAPNPRQPPWPNLQTQIDTFTGNITPNDRTAPCTDTPHDGPTTTDPKAIPTGYERSPALPCAHRPHRQGRLNLIRYSRLHHIGLSKHLRGTKVTVLINDLDIRVLHHETHRTTDPGKLTLDPTRDPTNPAASNRKLPTNRPHLNVPRHLSPGVSDITW